MSSGTQVDLDWPGPDTGADGAQSNTGVPPITGAHGAMGVRYPTDEEILGIDPPSPKGGYGGLRPLEDDNAVPVGARLNAAPKSGRADEMAAAKTAQAEACATGAMPAWMQVAAADPRHGAEAAQLWREHQEFRTAFASPEEARAVKELLPGGVRDVLSLREATQSVERIDAALFSGDARAQSEVVAELARANPAAFRSLFAEAAKLVAGGLRLDAGQFDGDQTRRVILSEAKDLSDGVAVDKQNVQRDSSSLRRAGAPQNDSVVEVGARAANPSSLESPASNLQNFDAAAYAAFERATNDAVARDVRGSIDDTLRRVLPDGVAEGAARRIGEDIFNEIHRALAADRTLSEQVAAVLRDPRSSAAADYGGQARQSLGDGGPRFGAAEQQRIASLLAGRAKQLVPSVARRVISEWTSSVLNTSRTKAARQAAAASRVDIAAPGGSLDSMPLRQMSPREVDYASMSDEEILGI